MRIDLRNFSAFTLAPAPRGAGCEQQTVGANGDTYRSRSTAVAAVLLGCFLGRNQSDLIGRLQRGIDARLDVASLDHDVAVRTTALGADIDASARRHGRTAHRIAGLFGSALAAAWTQAEGQVDAADLLCGIGISRRSLPCDRVRWSRDNLVGLAVNRLALSGDDGVYRIGNR